MTGATIDPMTTLNSVQDSKEAIALPVEEVRRIDRKLADGWGIDFHTQASAIAAFSAIEDRNAVTSYDAAYSQVQTRRGKGPSLVAEGPVFEAIAQQDILGPVTSEHRHYILDAVSTTIGLVRLLGLHGPILDLGCHAGFAASILAEHLENEVVGIDICSAAIALGQAWPARPSRVRLLDAQFPVGASGSYDLIHCVDAMPQQGKSVEPYLAAIFDRLNEGGVAVIVSTYWSMGLNTDHVRRIMTSRGISLGYADVVGGYGGATRDDPPTFSARAMLVFGKGKGRSLPAGRTRLDKSIEHEWAQFTDYANDPSTPTREKTQAFERALRGLESN